MKEKKLTAAQVHELEAYERLFRQATEAAWCSYPGQAGINKMLEVWSDLTGGPYPYKPGCPNCLLNLVRDLGTIYFAQKDEALAAEATAAPVEPEAEPAPEGEAPAAEEVVEPEPVAEAEPEATTEKVAEEPAEEKPAPEASTQSKKKNAPKRKK